MLYFRISDKRILFVSEYVIFLPLGLLIDFIIIRSVKRRRSRAKELEQLRRRVKLYKITHLH